MRSMKNHADCERGFSIHSESWYSKNLRDAETLDEITVGMYHREGGTTGEFCVRWTMLAGNPTPKLEVFDDAWSALHRFSDMLAWMASVDDQNISPQAFAEALRGLEITDRTNRENPHNSPGEREYASWVKSLKTHRITPPKAKAL